LVSSASKSKLTSSSARAKVSGVSMGEELVVVDREELAVEGFDFLINRPSGPRSGVALDVFILGGIAGGPFLCSWVFICVRSTRVLYHFVH
jgi:hypothetical protein